MEINIITLALLASIVNHHHFNLKENVHRKYYAVGSFDFGRWRAIGSLEYVSVYKNNNDIFEVIIWDNTNNSFKVSFHKKKEDADNTVKYLANTFSLPLDERD